MTYIEYSFGFNSEDRSSFQYTFFLSFSCDRVYHWCSYVAIQWNVEFVEYVKQFPNTPILLLTGVELWFSPIFTKIVLNLSYLFKQQYTFCDLSDTLMLCRRLNIYFKFSLVFRLTRFIWRSPFFQFSLFLYMN